MTLAGVVLDAQNPAGCPSPDAILWAEVVRLIAKDSQQLYAYNERLHAAGIKVALVWTLASVGDHPDPDVVRRIARRCPAEFHVVGNEPDAIYNLDEHGEPYDSPASDAMDEHRFGVWFHQIATAIRTVDPHALVILAGMVSGQPWAARKYVDVVERKGVHLDGIDLHLYNTDAPGLGVKVELYRAEFPALPLYMFEWSRPAEEILGFLMALEELGIAAACYHAYHQTDIEGLHDADGQPTDRYRALLAALAARPFVTSSPLDTTLSGEDMARIEEHDQQSDFPLGNRWAATGKTWKAHDVGGGVRIAGYDKGTVLEIDGECWDHTLAEPLPK